MSDPIKQLLQLIDITNKRIDIINEMRKSLAKVIFSLTLGIVVMQAFVSGILMELGNKLGYHDLVSGLIVIIACDVALAVVCGIAFLITD